MGLVSLYDTTLRDGAQGEGISFSLDDKLKIVYRLDELGIDYIEGGWPGSNPKDEEFFKKVRNLKLNNARIVAFSSTRRPGIKVENDSNILKLLEAGVDTVTIFAKSWDFHVTHALEITLDDNLDLIFDTVSFLKDKGLKVFFDAEHFFDGFEANPDYTLKTILTAQDAGADLIVLCDTNGGQLTSQIENTIKKVKEKVSVPLGIHLHNDGGLGVANSLAAYENGISQIQGTIGGIGERCGNADLCSIIPALKVKYNEDVITEEQLSKLKSVYHYVMEIANLIPQNQTPYVGRSAFTHKGGIHVSALQKNPATYEHIEPEKVGNRRRVLVSELSGKSNLKYKLKELGFNIDNFTKAELSRLTKKIKFLEHKGYQFEGADASFNLLVNREYGNHKPFFTVNDFKIISHNSGEMTNSEAVIKLVVNNEKVHVAAEGDGPVNALDNALRKGLRTFFPEIKNMKLIDYKVRVLNGDRGTAAKVRVLIETSNGEDTWTTVGVSTNIIQASWQALIDSIEYGLLIHEKKLE
ncbi:citramalate synthase [Halothermothrix orenii]|uniref:Citramalate synthase n=1 Tax=Halothermothrix orenii (strain H 168 / OCM 544 / DSM 9562) TaxID=373903 RepID=B8CX25_HALOH|nr:citramalate synthase [Halothermothrix orenii]ACL69844.1 2-isopropylmalate synthase [Halothermothrix orenii H 168]